jgi:hypothetical protein
MDNLERFIRDNRDDFDRELPSLEVWSKIDRKVGGGPGKVVRLTRRRITAYAAAAVILLGIGIFVGTQYQKQNIPVVATITGEEAPLPKQFVEVEDFYRHQYEEQVQQLASYQVDPTFKEDLKQFEDVMNELKTELAKAPKGNEDRIISAIIQNYQMKIDILKRVQERLEKINPNVQNKQKNEVSL